jgi:RNA polymerase sigma-70 factor (ECF subfamily)
MESEMSQHHGLNTFNNFERDVLPHLDSAYNLARWLTGNNQDAEDVVQDASLRAFKYFDTFQGGNCRAWWLAIVRNSCYTWMRRNRIPALLTPFDEETDSAFFEPSNLQTPQARAVDWQTLIDALENLSTEYREVVVLRELEGLTYKEIADVTETPIGTVMSRLARARKRLQTVLSDFAGEPQTR